MRVCHKKRPKKKQMNKEANKSNPHFWKRHKYQMAMARTHCSEDRQAMGNLFIEWCPRGTNNAQGSSKTCWIDDKQTRGKHVTSQSIESRNVRYSCPGNLSFTGTVGIIFLRPVTFSQSFSSNPPKFFFLVNYSMSVSGVWNRSNIPFQVGTTISYWI